MAKHEKQVESKVWLATLGSYVGAGILTIAVQALQDQSLISALPGPLSALLLPLAPALVALIGGYLGPHTPRIPGPPDLDTVDDTEQ